jgi:hypothetical protein
MRCGDTICFNCRGGSTQNPAGGGVRAGYGYAMRKALCLKGLVGGAGATTGQLRQTGGLYVITQRDYAPLT